MWLAGWLKILPVKVGGTPVTKEHHHCDVNASCILYIYIYMYNTNGNNSDSSNNNNYEDTNSSNNESNNHDTNMSMNMFLIIMWQRSRPKYAFLKRASYHFGCTSWNWLHARGGNATSSGVAMCLGDGNVESEGWLTKKMDQVWPSWNIRGTLLEIPYWQGVQEPS